ncbi:hypothetical protein MANAM107_03590 [Actinomyces capricornis]|uniref:Transposase IS204/IS1001/IS1096/IS1165 DDE domain-containing protein n=1 Tax=Actinomyces capricornis TaxID=2755559 RepID=A0ABM7U7Q2_9ACTO|nr:hypothetical protein MANAM107_03590 [Actinomyces capricornis]
MSVVIDLTPVREGSGPARLLDMIEGRSKKALACWLAQRDPAWRAGVEIVAMDGFTGYKTATAEQLPAARAVMDPFHVVKLAGDALDETRRRVQQATTGRPGRANDPLYTARRALLTRDGLLTERQAGLLKVLLADQRHTAVEVTWAVHQKMIDAYRNPDPAAGRPVMSALIDSIATGVPAGIQEVSRLGRTLNRPHRGHPWPTSTTPAPPTAPPRPSTTGSSTYAASPRACTTSPTTSPDPSSTPEASDTD